MPRLLERMHAIPGKRVGKDFLRLSGVWDIGDMGYIPASGESFTFRLPAPAWMTEDESGGHVTWIVYNDRGRVDDEVRRIPANCVEPVT